MQGYEVLDGRLRSAREEAPTAERALGALIEANVGFARDHPAHIHLMLRGELARLDKHPGRRSAGAGRSGC
ncbi:MAG TPA: hypothetical protein VFQ68_34400 [Streptosporangiaceae bacterium]|nr:hypothetical protein [Streptosporangiaceae bacterium]